MTVASDAGYCSTNDCNNCNAGRYELFKVPYSQMLSRINCSLSDFETRQKSKNVLNLPLLLAPLFLKVHAKAQHLWESTICDVTKGTYCQIQRLFNTFNLEMRP